MDTEWIEVRGCTWLHQAHFLKSLLEAAGIEVLIPNEHTLGVQPAFGLLLGGSGSHRPPSAVSRC